MPLSELVYFHGAHFAHIVAWHEALRLARIEREHRLATQRR